MPTVPTLPKRAALHELLLDAWRYPLQGAALATCAALAVCRYAILLPSLIGLIADIILWIAALAYAIDCMVHTANGYARPPEISLADNRSGSPRSILWLHVLLVIVVFAVVVLDHGGALSGFLFLLVVAVLPAIDMSLAFDGNLAHALNPATWLRIASRFGAAYLIPVLVNVLVGVALLMAALASAHLPVLLTVPVFGFVSTALLILDFHCMGLLVWHRRESIGLVAEAPQLVGQTREGADERLLRQLTELARTDPEAAAVQLSTRIREHHAPDSMHQLFRTLLHQLGRTDLLLKHGQFWIAQQCSHEQHRRALRLVRECLDLDPAFAPDNSEQAFDLVVLAERIGMRALAVELARTTLARWPAHPQAAHLRDIAAARA